MTYPILAGVSAAGMEECSREKGGISNTHFMQSKDKPNSS